MKFALPIVIVAQLSAPSFAAKPIAVYKKMQSEAPEVLQIEVVSVAEKTTDQGRFTKTHYVAVARVVEVQRTQSRLQDGDQIAIEYSRTRSKAPEPGPAPNPKINKGQKSIAFLKVMEKPRQKRVYTLAAEAFSFKRLD